MDLRISTIDKITILYRTGIKFLRGMVRRIFLKESHGMLLVGERADYSRKTYSLWKECQV